MGVLKRGQVIESIPGVSAGVSLVANRFPAVHRAYEDFLRCFADYAKTDANLARTIAYSEIVLFLRLAHQSRATLLGGDQVRRILADRIRLPAPRSSYTMRLPEFADAARRPARKLAEYIPHDWVDGLMRSR